MMTDATTRDTMMVGSTTTAGVRVTGLGLYPVKSLAGIAPDAAPVMARGLAGDRRWGVVDPFGHKVTAREEHGLLGLKAESVADGGIRLTDRAGGSLTVVAPRKAPAIPVDHRGQGLARPAAAEADAWLSDRIGRPLRLVWQDDDSRRPVPADRGGRDEDVNSLADAAPLLLTTDASLARLNDWLEEEGVSPLGHDRFRPNIVVDGMEPFAEDRWDGLLIGGVEFRRTMVCDRCVMTTIDRQTLESSKEPIRTLARHRAWDGATWFGIRLTPVLPLPDDATIRVGDEALVRADGRAA
jgi:uncharacterized protein YcbX